MISPTQVGAALASRQRVWMASGVVRTGLKTTLTGMWAEADSARAISCECSATCSSTSGPYRSWLPVTNQTSFFFRSNMGNAP